MDDDNGEPGHNPFLLEKPVQVVLGITQRPDCTHKSVDDYLPRSAVRVNCHYLETGLFTLHTDDTFPGKTNHDIHNHIVSKWYEAVSSGAVALALREGLLYNDDINDDVVKGNALDELTVHRSSATYNHNIIPTPDHLSDSNGQNSGRSAVMVYCIVIISWTFYSALKRSLPEAKPVAAAV